MALENASMKARALAFVLSEAAGMRSRSTVTIASGAGELEAGTILGTITATGKLVPSPNASTGGLEGAETASAILAYGVDATNADVEVTVIDRDAEVKSEMLITDTTVDDATKTATKISQVEALGIRVR